MMKKVLLAAVAMVMLAGAAFAGVGSDRFLEIWNEIHEPSNGYFSAEGSPHHSIETAIVEAPDYGHESTSELYSYWIWLELMYGKVTGDWSYFKDAWDKMERFIIPTEQTGNGNYKPDSPATYAAEWDLPDDYPSELKFGTPVGKDPVSAGLQAAYGPDIYGMHWLLDNDDWYEFGGSKPVYINTFQRGPQESTWETIPHPSIDDFQKGGVNGNGFMPLFTLDQSYSKQWRYTNAPDADARVIQAMFWGNKAYYDQGEPNVGYDFYHYTYLARKMGDFLRLSFFDKYFKTIGVDTNENTGGNGYDSAHYLLSWYYAWGGGIGANWAWRIGCSHSHFGYQNPMAAWVLTGTSWSGTGFVGDAPNAAQDWTKSLQRQLDLYQFVQSSQGLFSGGVTNSWKGRYAPYPNNAVFNGMVYDPNPVYHDPGSGTWFGWQAWSVERLAEYYWATGNTQSKTMLDKWVPFVVQNITADGSDFEIPVELEFSGLPQQNLGVQIKAYNKDVGVAACTAKTLAYYADKQGDNTLKQKVGTLLDSIWAYRDDKGVSTPETRGDYSRFLSQTVYVPQGMSGQMGNGDPLQSGATFLSIRSKYNQDPMFQDIKAQLNAGQDPTINYHRTWAQIDVALAMLVADDLSIPLSGSTNPTPTPSIVTGPGLVFMDPATTSVSLNSTVTVALKADTGTQKLAAYGITVTYPANLLSLTTVVAGSEGFLAAFNEGTPGTVQISGFDTTGKGPSAALDLLAVTFTSKAVEGNATIAIAVNSLTNGSYQPIGTPRGQGGTISVTNVKIGDANRDGIINIVDALMIAQYSVGQPAPINPAASDVNCDGIINIVDALIVAQASVGQVTLPMC